jgi:hypothetical protein
LASSERTPQTPGKRRGNALSNLFAILAVVFAVIAIVLYVRNPGAGSGVAPIPTAAPGGNQIVNVVEALKAEGLTVAQPPGLFIPRGALDVPGQGVEIDGQPGFVFLYPDADAARDDASGVVVDEVVPERIAGQPAPAGERRMALGSNVVVVMIGGDTETWQRVESVVAGLP